MTGQLHPDYEKAAVLAARVVGLDIAGIDFITADPNRSWKEVAGSICEINPCPGLRMHHTPGEGAPRDVATPIFDYLFPPGHPSRIPTAVITGSNGKTTTTRMTAHILRRSGLCTGLTCTDGIYVDDEVVHHGDLSGGSAVEQVLIDPCIDVAVLEIARGAIIKWGAGIDRCDVAAVINIVDEHLGEHGIETREDMAMVKGLLVELATEMVVLNADDPVVASLADRSSADRLCYVSRQTDNPLVEQHIATGQPAIRQEETAGESWIMIYDRGRRLPLASVADIPATLDGRAEHNIENAMFAAAVAYGLEQQPQHVADSLASFNNDHASNPGRFNIIDGFASAVILDYCHNSHGYSKTLAALASIEADRRYIAFSMPGNRRQQDYADVMHTVAGHFDEYHVYPTTNLRGRTLEQAIDLLVDGLRDAGIAAGSIFVHKSQALAIEHLLENDSPVELVFITGTYTTAWEKVQALLHA